MSIRIVVILLLATLASSAYAQQSTLIIRADAPCALTVNAVSQGQLQAGTAKAVQVNPGQQLIECRTDQGAIDQVLDIGPGTQRVLEIKPSMLTRYSAPGDGTVVDSQTGLVWAQRDNGSTINWNEASNYCRSLDTAGSGWRLPTMSELAGLYDPGGTLATPCGQSTCKAPQQLHLTGCCPWSSERVRSEEARFFHLHGGSRDFDLVSLRNAHIRALCVRRRY